jgi:hypothetical protein
MPCNTHHLDQILMNYQSGSGQKPQLQDTHTVETGTHLGPKERRLSQYSPQSSECGSNSTMMTETWSNTSDSNASSKLPIPKAPPVELFGLSIVHWQMLGRSRSNSPHLYRNYIIDNDGPYADIDEIQIPGNCNCNNSRYNADIQ